MLERRPSVREAEAESEVPGGTSGLERDNPQTADKFISFTIHERGLANKKLLPPLDAIWRP